MSFFNPTATIQFFQRIQVPLARVALFVIYVWFGVLKIFDVSPASPLVNQLFQETIPFMSFETFLVLFGLFEVFIGILFLIPRADIVAIPLFFLHMITTTMPLVMIPAAAWAGFFIPTLEGQYIIKNIALIAAVVTIGASYNSAPRFERT